MRWMLICCITVALCSALVAETTPNALHGASAPIGVTPEQGEVLRERYSAAMVRVRLEAIMRWTQEGEPRSRPITAEWPGVVIAADGTVVVPDQLNDRFPMLATMQQKTEKNTDTNTEPESTGATTMTFSLNPGADGTPQPSVSRQPERRTSVEAVTIITANGSEIPAQFLASDDKRRFAILKPEEQPKSRQAMQALAHVTIPTAIEMPATLSPVVIISRLSSVFGNSVAMVPAR